MHRFYLKFYIYFSGEGHSPLPRLLPQWEGVYPPTPHPRPSWPLLISPCWTNAKLLPTSWICSVQSIELFLHLCHHLLPLRSYNPSSSSFTFITTFYRFVLTVRRALPSPSSPPSTASFLQSVELFLHLRHHLLPLRSYSPSSSSFTFVTIFCRFVLTVCPALPSPSSPSSAACFLQSMELFLHFCHHLLLLGSYNPSVCEV